jgi:adenine-specific DNA-methyltransferase
VDIAHKRIEQEVAGTLRTRPMNKPVYDPNKTGKSLTKPPWSSNPNQMALLEDPSKKERYHS